MAPSSGDADYRQSRQTARENAVRLLDELAGAGARTVCTLPETWLAGLFTVLDADDRFTKVPVAREEEGIGILTGAFFGGKPGALLMSNSGLLTCCCALNGLASRSGIPMLLMVVQRGELGETQVLQGNIATATTAVLDALDVRHFRLRTPDDLPILGQAFRLALVLRQPVAVLMGKEALLDGASPYWFREQQDPGRQVGQVGADT